MRHEQACLGMFVRLLSDWHGIPKGTIGSIDTVETAADGAWSFTVFWEPHRPLGALTPGRTRTRTGFQSGSLGLRLWEEDLPRFEVINQEQKDVATLHVGTPSDSGSTPLCLFSALDVDQLTLPFGDREFVEEDHPQLAFASAGADADRSRRGVRGGTEGDWVTFCS